MSKLIDLKTLTDDRGNLTVFEADFDIKRVFYIYGANNAARGGHRHKNSVHLLACLQGSCIVYSTDGISEDTYCLASPSQAVLLQPEDWHQMYNFSSDAILMVLASEHYNESDYIYERYD
jgi:dTDP-4-dehydrorhamnose 3,5-epimerase-like enzyme